MSARLRVRLTPRAARDAIDGWRDGVLRVRVTAPPVDGKANTALARLLARALDVPPSAVGVVAGHTTREKTVEVAALTDEALMARLGNAGRS